MKAVSAILLAAGESRRMGRVNKLALPIEGQPLLKRTALALLASQLQDIVVVVGHEEDIARKILVGLPLKVVHNPDFKQGQMHSVHCGMAALPKPCEGVMICLSDMPLLESEDIDYLIGAFLGQPGISVLVPTYRGLRGNPIVLSYRHRRDLLAGDRHLGCKHLIDKHPDWVTPLEMANDHVVFDLDTPEDLAQLHKRLAPNGQVLKGALARQG